MLSLFRKSKKGKIEKEFSWLSIKRIALDIDKSDLDTIAVVGSLCRLAIFGGLDLKQTIDSKKLLKGADPDRIVSEIIAFTWCHIYSQCLKSSNVDIYEDEKLADAVYNCSSILLELLNNLVSFEIKKNYLAPYLNMDLITGTEVLAQRLLEIGNVKMPGDIKDNVGVAMATQIYSSAMIPAITDTSVNILKIYLDTHEVE